MNHPSLFGLVLTSYFLTLADSASMVKRSPYFANHTACYINGIIYEQGDAIPSEHPCEVCRCRPPGFSCQLKQCPIKPGCCAINVDGQCCPEYECGCTYDGRIFSEGQRIPHSPNPCVTCYCRRNIVRCALNECNFRFDCEPEYVPGQCCPRYDHCNRSIPQKHKFRSSILQNNMEFQQGQSSPSRQTEDTTEEIKVMRDEHRSKSSLMVTRGNPSQRKKKDFAERRNNTQKEEITTVSTTNKPTIVPAQADRPSTEVSNELATSANTLASSIVEEITTIGAISRTEYETEIPVVNIDDDPEPAATNTQESVNLDGRSDIVVTDETTTLIPQAKPAKPREEVDLFREESSPQIESWSQISQKEMEPIKRPATSYVNNIYKSTISFFTNFFSRFGR